MNENRTVSEIGDPLKKIGKEDIFNLQRTLDVKLPKIPAGEQQRTIHAERTVDRTVNALKVLEEELRSVDPIREKEWVKSTFSSLMEIIRQRRPGAIVPRFPGSKKDLERQEKERQKSIQAAPVIIRPMTMAEETAQAVASLRRENETMNTHQDVFDCVSFK